MKNLLILRTFECNEMRKSVSRIVTMIAVSDDRFLAVNGRTVYELCDMRQALAYLLLCLSTM